MEFMKVVSNDEMMAHLYVKYFQASVKKLISLYKLKIDIVAKTKKKVKKADVIRIENTDEQLKKNKKIIYEFVLIDIINNMLECYYDENNKWLSFYYSIYYLMKNNMSSLNIQIKKLVGFILDRYQKKLKLTDVVKLGYNIIEKKQICIAI